MLVASLPVRCERQTACRGHEPHSRIDTPLKYGEPDWQTLLRRVTRFTTYVMPRVEKAFEPGEDPKIVAPWQNIENDLGMLGHLGSDRGYGNPRQINTARDMCERMADLLEAIAQNKSVAAAYREAASDLPTELRLSEV